MLMKPEYLCFWTAVLLYGISSFSYILGAISRHEKLFSIGLYLALCGFIPHVAAIALRWRETGVTPFISISESITFGIGVTILIFLAFQFLSARIRPLGVLVVPVSFVLLGWAGTLIHGAASQLSPALQSGWIWVHIIGAATGFASVLTAAALGLMYLLKEKKTEWIQDRLPELPVMDTLAYRFIAGGFIMYGLMLVSGAFWANQVKGTYWNWDPVEVWSLISWLMYGVYLHLRATYGWRGNRLAWYAIIAALVMVVSYWGIPFSVETFHAGFRIEH
jgi:cytochrome c-type biogenesis protein CcsB